MNKLICQTILVAAFALLPSIAGAAVLKEKQFSFSILPGRDVNKSLECPTGMTLISGGYTLDISAAGLAVPRNYPQSDSSWRVDLENVSSKRITGAYWITILCE